MELLAKRLRNLEDEVDDLSQNVRELRDELQYLQQLIDAGQISEPPTRLRPPEA
jgi:prefoldin subunit 5